MKADVDILFVKYTGKFPSLCGGTLTISIGGKEWDIEPHMFRTTGRCARCMDGDYMTESGEWVINEFELPDEVRKYADDIERVMNKHVKHGCCGGCA